MKKSLSQYFFELESKSMAQQIAELSFDEKVQRVHIGDGSYYVKNAANKQIISAVASSRMYNEIGIKTPKLFLLKGAKNGYTRTIEKEVKSINGLIYTLANSDVEFAKIETTAFGKYKWELFYDSRLIFAMLKVMTSECLEGLKDLFLVDELRTDVDRHLKNYFFYKKLDSDKYEGVVAIDLEQMVIYKYCGDRRDDFDNFLYYPYQSATPQQVSDELSYLERVRNIRELIEDGALSARNIETLKRAITYDFPQEIKNVAEARGIRGREKRGLVTNVEKLWEYNKKTIGKDLGL